MPQREASSKPCACAPAELGILYAKYKPEKLMEHLKLFSTRINIPRLIRVTEEYAHWKELVFLYVQVRAAAPAPLAPLLWREICWVSGLRV